MNESLESTPESIEAKRERLFREIEEKSKKIDSQRKNLHPHDFTDFYKRTKTEFLREFPEFKKMIDVIFGVNSFIRSHEAINYHGESLVPEQRKKELINLTSWQHKATEALIEFGWNKDLADNFWQKVESFYRTFSHHEEDFGGYKRGVTGQARAFLILNDLGYRPRLATPKEDAFEGTDFYISYPGRNKPLRTQIKLSSTEGHSMVELVDCGSPNIIVESQDGRRQTRFQTQAIEEMTHIRGKCGDLSQKEGKQIRSLLIILNESDFDPKTAMPRESFLERIRQELAQKLE